MQTGRHIGSRTGIAISASLGALALCFSGSARSDTTPGQDAVIEARVRDALASDPKILTRHIYVWVKNGVVHLGGFVQSDQDVQLAKRDAQSVPGVVSIKDELELKGPAKTSPQ